MAKPLCTASTLYEAQMILDLLRESLIRAEIRNENLVGLAGLLPEATTLPTIWVEHESNWERARAIVDEFEARRFEQPPPDSVCPACGETNPGNFELCWNCRAELPSP